MSRPLVHPYVVKPDGTTDAKKVQENLQALALAIPGVIEPWRIVGAAGQPAFQNGWVNLGGTEPTARFCKSPLGIVYVEAAIKTGTADTTIFTLPAGYRPAFDLKFAAGRNGGTGAVIGGTVLANGNVSTLNTAANANISITLSFRADQ